MLYETIPFPPISPTVLFPKILFCPLQIKFCCFKCLPVGSVSSVDKLCRMSQTACQVTKQLHYTEVPMGNESTWFGNFPAMNKAIAQVTAVQCHLHLTECESKAAFPLTA